MNKPRVVWQGKLSRGDGLEVRLVAAPDTHRLSASYLGTDDLDELAWYHVGGIFREEILEAAIIDMSTKLKSEEQQ